MWQYLNVFSSLIIVLSTNATPAHAATVGTAFTYQGELTRNGTAVSDSCRMVFTLFDVMIGGDPLAGPVTVNPVVVNEGVFTVALDFGEDVFEMPIPASPRSTN